MKWLETSMKSGNGRMKLPWPIYRCHYRMLPTMPNRFPVKTAQNLGWPAAACDQVARDSNRAPECKMDPTNDECTACNGTREMRVPKGNHVATNNRPPDAIGNLFCASGKCWRLAIAANCPRDSHNTWPTGANFPCTRAPHTSYTDASILETRRPYRWSIESEQKALHCRMEIGTHLSQQKQIQRMAPNSIETHTKMTRAANINLKYIAE